MICDPQTETANRIGALILGYRDGQPALTREVLRRQAAEREAIEQHDYELADDLDERGGE